MLVKKLIQLPSFQESNFPIVEMMFGSASVWTFLYAAVHRCQKVNHHLYLVGGTPTPLKNMSMSVGMT